MTALHYRSGPISYQLVEELREPPAVSAVRRAPFDEVDHDDLVFQKLGAKCWGRLHHFRSYYSAGWGGKGLSLSPKALSAFFRFVEEAKFPGTPPSLFLTDRGGIELSWEDAGGRAVQVEFTGTGAEFYQASTEEEGTVPFDKLGDLAQRLSA